MRIHSRSSRRVSVRSTAFETADVQRQQQAEHQTKTAERDGADQQHAPVPLRQSSHTTAVELVHGCGRPA
jgi:hypothetical protein